MMGCFGEITEPLSRALWENYESDEEDIEVELSWDRESVYPATVDLLMVVEGASAVEFVERCVITDKPMNTVKGTKVSLYSIPDKNLIICTSLNEEDVKASEITSLLKPWIMLSKRIISIKSLSTANFKSQGGLDTTYLIRSLHTTCTQDTIDVHVLEQPNIINGLSAGVMSLCEHMELPASVYALYMDYPLLGLDSSNAEPLIKLFDDLHITCSKPFVTKFKFPSNLYL